MTVKIVFGEDGYKPVKIIDEEGRDLAPSLRIVSIKVELPGARELSRATIVLESPEVECEVKGEMVVEQRTTYKLGDVFRMSDGTNAWLTPLPTHELPVR